MAMPNPVLPDAVGPTIETTRGAEAPADTVGDCSQRSDNPESFSSSIGSLSPSACSIYASMSVVSLHHCTQPTQTPWGARHRCSAATDPIGLSRLRIGVGNQIMLTGVGDGRRHKITDLRLRAAFRHADMH